MGTSAPAEVPISALGSVGAQHSLLHGSHDGVGAVALVQLGQDVGHVSFDGVTGKTKVLRNVVVGASERYQSQHLDLTLAQPGIRLAGPVVTEEK